jgi:hypothetical protein
LLFEAHLLEVQDDFGYIFHYPFDGREFVVYATDPNGGNGISFQRAQQHTAQGVAYGEAVTGLEGAEFELAIRFGGVVHDDLIGLLKVQYSHGLIQD